MWVRDSYDVNLLGLGGSGDAFPNCGGATGRPSKKTHLLRHLYIKMIILPRQARDKHRENSKKRCVLGATGRPCKIPFDFHIPSDFPPYNWSTIRIERTPRYKLVSLINNDRGVESGKQSIHAIHPVPLTPAMLNQSRVSWPAADVPMIIESMWAPWPGFALPPSLWAVVGEMDGTLDANALLSAPLDRPILWQRGY
jgi:hypothetical protein